MKNKRNKEWKRYRMTGVKGPHDAAQNNFEKLNSELYNTYVDKMKTSLKQDPSKIWQYVNSKKSTDNKPKVMQLGAERTSNESEQANMFANFFATNYTDSSTPDTQQTPIDQQHPLVEFQLAFNFVLDELKAVDTKKGTGPDGMHPLLLKNCADNLAARLTEIFNESLRTGHFPHKWNRSSVSPVFKKGARSKIENYRCIAKFSDCSYKLWQSFSSIW